MFKRLVHTHSDYSLLIARLVLGFLFLVHGDQLLLGGFGGYGLKGSMQFFTQQLGIPEFFAFLAICAQFFGGLMLIMGLVGRAAAGAIICVMVVAVAKVHWQFGLFMNWFGAQKGEGFEYHLLAVAVAMVIALKGSGALSIDRLLVRRDRNARAAANGVTYLADSERRICGSSV
jgi:putative oxidoreductase